MIKINTFTLIKKLRNIFARFGLPNVIVSDSGPQFRASEFVEFWKINGIQFYTSLPFYSVINEVTENTMKSFKSGIKKALSDKNKWKCIVEYIYLLLSMKRPSEWMFGRKLKTRIYFIKVPSENF